MNFGWGWVRSSEDSSTKAVDMNAAEYILVHHIGTSYIYFLNPFFINQTK